MDGTVRAGVMHTVIEGREPCGLNALMIIIAGIEKHGEGILLGSEVVPWPIVDGGQQSAFDRGRAIARWVRS